MIELNAVVEKLLEITEPKDVDELYNEIVKAFGDYTFDGSWEVVVLTPNQMDEMDDFVPNEEDHHCVCINKIKAPEIFFTLKKADKGMFCIKEAYLG